jgi:hypothetical protein
MRTSSLSRPFFWGVVALLGLGLFLPVQELPAQDETGCIAVDKHGMPRDCTFLEEHGACLWNALDSYDTCREDSDGFLDRAGCEIGVQVDLLACNLGMPVRLIKSLLS